MKYQKGLLRKRGRWLVVSVALAALIALVIQVIPALALPPGQSYDMTYRDATDMVNGAIIETFTPTDSTGTGYWRSFLRVSSGHL